MQGVPGAAGGFQHAVFLGGNGHGNGNGHGPLRRAPSNLLMALSPLDHFQVCCPVLQTRAERACT